MLWGLGLNWGFGGLRSGLGCEAAVRVLKHRYPRAGAILTLYVPTSWIVEKRV